MARLQGSFEFSDSGERSTAWDPEREGDQLKVTQLLSAPKSKPTLLQGKGQLGLSPTVQFRDSDLSKVSWLQDFQVLGSGEVMAKVQWGTWSRWWPEIESGNGELAGKVGHLGLASCLGKCCQSPTSTTPPLAPGKGGSQGGGECDSAGRSVHWDWRQGTQSLMSNLLSGNNDHF